MIPVIMISALLMSSFNAVGWFDDVEAGVNGWTHYWISGTAVPDNWAISSSRSHSATNSWHSGIEVANWVNGGDTALESPPIDVTATSSSYLNFWHYYDFDYWPGVYPDGGIVEINDGSGWQQIFPVGGYDGIIETNVTNPLESRWAFTGFSNGWLYETFDISAYTGSIISVRFHVGWDYGTTSPKEGWYIDDVEITNSTVPPHDLMVTNLIAPSKVDPNTNVTIDGSVMNNGMSDETNVSVNLTADGVLVDQMTIPFLQNGTTTPVTLYWTPIVEKTYNVCLEAAAVSGENFTANNIKCVSVEVITVKGVILFDQTHGTDGSMQYSILIADLVAQSYDIRYQSTTPIMPSDLVGVDVMIVPQAHISYQASELTAIMNFVSAGNGLFVIGDDSEIIYTDLTSFAGISWVNGGTGGLATSITPHQITNGITSVQLSSPMTELIVTPPAISLVRDPGGGDTLAISSTPGRVAAFCDENSLRDGGILNAQNEQLALNIIDWLLGVVYEHDVGVVSFSAPRAVDPGVVFYVNASIKNLGTKDETNVTVDFKVNTVPQNNTTIPSLVSGASQGVSFSYSSTVEGFYDVEISIRPVPVENFTGNNQIIQTVHVGYSLKVGVYDHPSTFDISYFMGINSNLYLTYLTVLDTDPMSRFVTSIITDLSSSTLAGLDVIVLPDNAVPDVYLSSVATFLSSRKGVVGVDSAVSYMAYSGALWPSAAGTHGWGVYWDAGGFFNDQMILMSHEITADYTVGSVVSSMGGSMMYKSMLPPDALALTGSFMLPTFAYVAAREEPGRGRVVELGPMETFTVPLDLEELVRDAVYWAGGAIQTDHDIAVSYFQTPKAIQPHDNVTLDVEIRNVGLNNESNIEVNFTVDGALFDQRNISFMSPDQTDQLTFNWIPSFEKMYTLCVEVTMIPNENITSNNRVCQDVRVKKVKGFVLWDHTHSAIPMSNYPSLIGVLASLDYVIDPLFASPITSSDLAGYDVLVLAEPSFAYDPAERIDIQAFVSSGGGLLLWGDSGTSIYNDLTSFAGISWTFGGWSGVTTDITPHDVTVGVNSVTFPSPNRNLIPVSPATSLIRDGGGGHVLAVSESPGRVAAISDETLFSDMFLNMSDNRILAINLFEWLTWKRFEHDLEIHNLSAPSPMERGVVNQVFVQVRNIGLNNESNVNVKLTLDGATIGTKTIPFIGVDTIQNITFAMTPNVLGFHNLGVEAVPVLDENETADNLANQMVFIQDTIPPQAPSNLRVKSSSDPTALELTWSPNSEADLDHYSVYMSVDGTNYYFEAGVPQSSTTYTDSGLLQGTTYYYQVTASDDIPNESPPSSPAVGIPGLDTDQDGLIDIYDPDDDNDGVRDEKDDFPTDQNEWRDTDGDGIGDNSDDDDDGDTIPDDSDLFPKDPYESYDSDGDGIGDNADQDDDNDGIPDLNDAFPFNATEWLDTDGDGVGNNVDTDDDNDGIPDESDPNPLFPALEGDVNVNLDIQTENLEAIGLATISLLVILLIAMIIFMLLYFVRGKPRNQPEEEPDEDGLESEETQEGETDTEDRI